MKLKRILEGDIRAITNEYTADEFAKILAGKGIAGNLPGSKGLGEYFLYGLKSMKIFNLCEIFKREGFPDDEIIPRAIQVLNALGGIGRADFSRPPSLRDLSKPMSPAQYDDVWNRIINNVQIRKSTLDKWKYAVQVVDDFKGGKPVYANQVKQVLDAMKLPVDNIVFPDEN